MCLLTHFQASSSWATAPLLGRYPKAGIHVVCNAAGSTESKEAEARSSFLQELCTSLGPQRSFLKLTLSSNAAAKQADAAGDLLDESLPLHRLVNVYGRVVALKNIKSKKHEGFLQLLLRYEHRDVTKNLPLRSGHLWTEEHEEASTVGDFSTVDAALEAALSPLLDSDRFRRARLFSTTGDVELKLKGAKSKVHSQRPTLAPSGGSAALGGARAATHDRAKAVLLEPSAPFLQRLGVSGPDGKGIVAWKVSVDCCAFSVFYLIFPA